MNALRPGLCAAYSSIPSRLRLWRSFPLRPLRSAAFSTSTHESDDWAWIPPRHAESSESVRSDDQIIPVIKGQLLTFEEIQEALTRQGATEITRVELSQPLDTIKEFIIACGSSPRHLYKMSSTIVDAVQARDLKFVGAYTGAEGSKNDDWHVIDCYNFAVHLLMPKTRKALNIEGHWKAETRPVLPDGLSIKDYDSQFDQLLEKFPVSPLYVAVDDAEEETSVSKKSFKNANEL